MAALKLGDSMINGMKTDNVIEIKHTVIIKCNHEKKQKVLSHIIDRKSKTKNHVKRNSVMLPVILSPTTAFLFSI
jgi:hypothetical protein